MSDASDTRQQAFHDIALRWMPDVMRFARSLTRDDSLAEDLVQETYLRAWRHWDSFTPGGEARPWLFTIARNSWRKQAPKDARFIAVEDDVLQALAEPDYPLDAPDAVLDALAHTDLGPAIRSAIVQLPETFRTVVELVDLQELTYVEASQLLGVPVGTVRSRLFRARRRLQESLLDHARDAGLVPSTSTEDAR